MTDFPGATWRKSRRSQNGGACVEVARVDGVIGVRDSRNPTGPVLVFTSAHFEAFLNGALISNGDLPQR
nr:DUF397 domain-containing protein [Micromonospora sp. DSM 115978]